MGVVIRIKSKEIKTALTVMLLMLVFQAGAASQWAPQLRPVGLLADQFSGKNHGLLSKMKRRGFNPDITGLWKKNYPMMDMSRSARPEHRIIGVLFVAAIRIAF
jgi:hypothetical protein